MEMKLDFMRASDPGSGIRKRSRDITIERIIKNLGPRDGYMVCVRTLSADHMCAPRSTLYT